MLSATDVVNQKFKPTKFREGYDQDEVDDFLDRVTRTLGALETGQLTDDAVTADELATVRFQPTKFREGYDQNQVDDFLARVRERLTQAPPADVVVDAPSAMATVRTAPVISTSALVMEVQMAHSRRPAGAPDAVVVRLPDGRTHSVADVRSTATGIELVLG
ncbi:DivIVA domain-containing protein [Cellulomonas sp. zg-ZUI188]|uniref:Cell wall synthesis protein Wag31 n=1 Tax=Cellulomonas fengjieae TaxID=2819978 RepID=A0ABS3SH99_9CELL|nr:DivIVA domain-containing protein [Cellulomonas fengjieae]QVI66299.1 DivIVA domain-containing protein [Cellulomonas fengjieae]